MPITPNEMDALSQAPVYYAAMLLTLLPPSPERETVLDMLEVVEERLAGLSAQGKKQTEHIFFTLSPEELIALYHAILGYVALNAPGTNTQALRAVTQRMKPFLPRN